MTVKYGNPPINELVLGLYFDQPTPMRAEYAGVFWASVRDEFPSIQQQPIIAPPAPSGGQIYSFEFSGPFEMPMPRFWLEAADGNTLMQLQNNAFLFNWRKRDTTYPHYDSVKAGFDKNYATYLRFLRKEFNVTPSIQIAELTYINIVESCEYWTSAKDTGRVFPSFQFASPPKGINDPDFHQTMSERFAPDLTITSTIRNGAVPKPTGQVAALVFEYRAIGLLGSADKTEADAWFNRAHEAIGVYFNTMTSPEIQKQYWQQINHGT